MDTRTALVPVAVANPDGAELDTLTRLAGVMARSGFYSKARTPEQAAVLVLLGREMGIPAGQALAGLHVIEGKPSQSAFLMGALLARGGVTWKVDEKPGAATITFSRPGWSDRTATWTRDDAQRAGLTGKDNWRKYERAMLYARAFAEGARGIGPDLLLGVAYTPEELGATVNEEGEPVNVTPAVASSAPLEPAASTASPAPPDAPPLAPRPNGGGMRLAVSIPSAVPPAAAPPPANGAPDAAPKSGPVRICAAAGCEAPAVNGTGRCAEHAAAPTTRPAPAASTDDPLEREENNIASALLASALLGPKALDAAFVALADRLRALPEAARADFRRLYLCLVGAKTIRAFRDAGCTTFKAASPGLLARIDDGHAAEWFQAHADDVPRSGTAAGAAFRAIKDAAMNRRDAAMPRAPVSTNDPPPPTDADAPLF